jgi:hypothetical protein
MAISQVGFGLKPINKIGSNYNAAQVSEYRHVARPSTYGIMAFQAPVEIQRGLRTQVAPLYNINDGTDGSFIGAQFVGSDGKPVFTDHYVSTDLNHYPSGFQAGFNDSFTQFIADDPYQLYLIKTDGDLTISLINAGYQFDGPASDNAYVSEDGKRSIVKLDASTRNSGSTNMNLQFVTFGKSIDDVQTSKDVTYNVNDGILDAGSNLIVRLNKTKMQQKASTRGYFG